MASTISTDDLARIREKLVPRLEYLSALNKTLAEEAEFIVDSERLMRKAEGVDFVLSYWGDDLKTVDTEKRARELLLVIRQGHLFAPGEIQEFNPGIIACADELEAYFS
jgi:hypothetical protein